MRDEVRAVAARIGYTDKCPGCRAVKNNFVSRPTHSAECRARMEPEMRKSARGGQRLEQWENRLSAEVETRIRDENKLAKKTQGVHDNAHASA